MQKTLSVSAAKNRRDRARDAYHAAKARYERDRGYGMDRQLKAEVEDALERYERTSHDVIHAEFAAKAKKR